MLPNILDVTYISFVYRILGIFIVGVMGYIKNPIKNSLEREGVSC